MRDLSNHYSRITCLIPNAVGTDNYDDLTDSALDPTDITTSATGQVETWYVYEIHCRLGGPTFTDLMTADGNGLEKGDISLFVKPVDIELVKSVMVNNRAYFFINKNTYRPFGGADQAGIFHGNEYKIDLKSFSPVVRAAGY